MPRRAEADASRLSRERILETALAVVEADGLEALSMRRLAQELDVWPMSLYRYFQDKDALLDALAGAVANEIAMPVSGGSWRHQVRDLAERARGAFERHPGALAPAAARLSDGGLPILEAAGLQAHEAELAWQALMAFTAGAAGSEAFDYGLEMLLDGIETRVAAGARQ
jgi:AcrR family transcriptional regulator